MPITKTELYSIFTLSIVFSLRMLGVFMVLPILAIYAISLKGSSEYLIGMSMGVYGITQIIFQLPFSYISDKLGRKPVIITGLLISAIGSTIAAISDNIWGLIIGRSLQGSGAISSVLIAWLLDSIREQHRSTAMATIGISFGITFISSMILGPFIAKIFGLHGIFQIITIITGFSIILVCVATPTLNTTNIYTNIGLMDMFNSIKLIITHLKLSKLNFNIFCLHTILTLNFIVWPKILISLGWHNNIHFKIYALIMLISILVLLPYIYYSKTKTYEQDILIIPMNILLLSELIMFFMTQNRWLFLLGIQLFFIAFNIIESIVPALINKISPIQYKGTAISICSIGQFLGIGLGGILGGLLLEIQGLQIVLLLALIIAIINFIIK